ncbi:unnamed protein product [Candidula unifasciata]|uniref:Transmembrane protein 42 n=1 Tax=Candidula unifasciata TaxID=100452 RepID=A0A8S3YE73_9EUPU|nr:unnamed protein product [Candidula unifasciata]
MGMRGSICAVQAGSCAALASICAKLALTPSVTTTLVESLSLWVSGSVGVSLTTTDQLVLVTRVISAVGILLFNAVMWTQFTKSMHLCSSTLEATASTTSSNFFFTAVLGKVLFREQLGTLWYLGSVLMIVGLAVLHRGSEDQMNNIQQAKKTS